MNKQVTLQVHSERVWPIRVNIISAICEGQEVARVASAETNSRAIVELIVKAGSEGYSFDKDNLAYIRAKLGLDEDFEDTCAGAGRTFAYERIRNYIPVM